MLVDYLKVVGLFIVYAEPNISVKPFVCGSVVLASGLRANFQFLNRGPCFISVDIWLYQLHIINTGDNLIIIDFI